MSKIFNKPSFLLLAAVAMIVLSSLSIETQAASTSSAMAMEMAMGDMTVDEYWARVRGDPFKSNGKTRCYYVGAVEVEWDYAPDGYDKITGGDFTDRGKVFTQSTATQIGSKYKKCLYKEFTDCNFKKQKARAPEDEYLGYMGPVIRGEVGDTIKIVFKNFCPFPASMHPHGVFYDKDSEGAPYVDGTSGKFKKDDAVPTGETHTYTWLCPERAGPGPMDGSSVMWMYHSHTDEDIDFAAGLVGFMAITRKGMARADGSPKDVDRELFFQFSTGNENISPYLQYNWETYTTPPQTGTAPQSPSNNKLNINGYMYGNGPMITMKQKQRVRWYMMSMGRGGDNHSPHTHGNRWLMDGLSMDVGSLLPAEMMTADMVPDAVGIWLYHCHVNNHIPDGMITRYQVLPCS